MSTETATPPAKPSLTPPASSSNTPKGDPKFIQRRTPPAASDPNATPAKKPSIDDMIDKAFKGELNKPADADKGDAPPPSESKPSDTPPPAPETKKTPSVFDKVKPKEEVKPQDSEVDHLADHVAPKEASEATQQHWASLKKASNEKIKEAEKRYKDAQAQLETFKKATPAEIQEVGKLKQELQAAHDRLAVLDIQSTPEHARQFTEPKNRAVSEAKDTLAFYGREADINAILAKPAKEFSAAVSELTKDMNDFDKQTVQNAMRNVYRLSAEERSILSKSSEIRTQLEAKNALASKQAFEETFGKLGDMDNLISQIEIPDDASPDEKTALASYNAEMATVRQRAEKYAFGSLSHKDAAALASKAAILDTMHTVVIPRMEKEFRSVVAERNALAKELTAIREAKNPGDFSITPKGGDAKGNAKPRSIDDAVKEWASKEGIQ